MNKIIIAGILALTAMGSTAYAIDLKGILGNAGGAVSGVVEGLFTQSDITVEQMAGTWTATGSAVCFQSENFLQKAGGSAVAGTIESKLDPYYKQYGLTGSVLTVDTDGSFSLKVKSISLKGKITKTDDGNFEFAFTPFGSFKIGSIKAYVEKPVGGLDVMFDANKLKSLISAVASFTGNSLAKTAGSLLDSYEGLCVGFAFKGEGTSSSSQSGVGGVLNSILTGGSGSKTQSSSGNTVTEESTTVVEEETVEESASGNNQSNAINQVKNVLKGLFGN